LLQRALEASGDDLDSAVKSLNELRLESEALAVAAVCEPENSLSTALKLSTDGTCIYPKTVAFQELWPYMAHTITCPISLLVRAC
jgi:hypothetical protein